MSIGEMITIGMLLLLLYLMWLTRYLTQKNLMLQGEASRMKQELARTNECYNKLWSKYQKLRVAPRNRPC